MMKQKISYPLLDQKEIETKLKADPRLENFWKILNPVILFRNLPSLEDPVYEIQLVWELGERLESFAWVWVDALKGQIINYFPD